MAIRSVLDKSGRLREPNSQVGRTAEASVPEDSPEHRIVLCRRSGNDLRQGVSDGQLTVHVIAQRNSLLAGVERLDDPCRVP